MTALPQQAVLRTIFVHPRMNADRQNGPGKGLENGLTRGPLPTHRLLRDRGHDVTSTESLQDALRQMENESVDLLIVEQPDAVQADLEPAIVEQLQSLPLDQQPRELAIISNSAQAVEHSLSPLGPRVHVLLKPLHVHGLLQLLRNLEDRRA